MTTHRAQEFAILGKNVTATNWNGKPMTLAQYEGATMPQTPAGSAVFAYQNKTTGNNLGKLTLLSGGGLPTILQAQAQANQPSILVSNWGASNLNITNTSPAKDTPMWIEMFGFGMPGVNNLTLPVGPTGIVLQSAAKDLQKATATGIPQPNYMQLIMTSNTSNLSILCLIGGPLDGTGNNAYVFALNWPAGNPVPPGYQVTSGNTISYEFNWGSSSVFVANMSPQTAADVQVTLISL